MRQYIYIYNVPKNTNKQKEKVESFNFLACVSFCPRLSSTANEPNEKKEKKKKKKVS